MIDINDDLGVAVKPYRVIAALAVHGRLPLLEHTIRRLYQKNGCYRVVCSGSNPEDKALCISLGAIWVHHDNRHLGGKWNFAFKAAKEYEPDAVLFVGSSDWVCDNWIPLMQPHVEAHGFAGVPGCYLADLSQNIRLCHWKGYDGYRAERADETIGIGRMLSRRLLDAIKWEPFRPTLKNSLDRSMKDNAASHGFTDFMVDDERLKALSLSTVLWLNKHKFWMHYPDMNGNMMIPSELISEPESWLKQNFPEAFTFYDSIREQMNQVVKAK
jgi:hypothetical protein